mmetsp:Transcript_32310/g.51745  ORF Transcript_32310/g.51745 Transcript_32310/m.51745 type:complete len:299 (-) Transcript_32310:280-1176(-)
MHTPNPKSQVQVGAQAGASGGKVAAEAKTLQRLSLYAGRKKLAPQPSLSRFAIRKTLASEGAKLRTPSRFTLIGRLSPHALAAKLGAAAETKDMRPDAKQKPASEEAKPRVLSPYALRMAASEQAVLKADAFVPTTDSLPLVTKCAKFIMKKGKLVTAVGIMHRALSILQNLTPRNNKPGGGKEVGDALTMVRVAINNVKPAFELRKARFGGTTQFVPGAMPVHKQESFALRAIMATARAKHRKSSSSNKHMEMYTFAYFLAQEFQDAYKNKGTACLEKHKTMKLAENNRNNARRRWW